jgi:heme/copper-type cytochrome/quinol oxidase subunit 2
VSVLMTPHRRRCLAISCLILTSCDKVPRRDPPALAPPPDIAVASAPAVTVEDAISTGHGKHEEWDEQQPLEVILRGSDFRWHITYPGEDGLLLTEDDVHTQRHLNLPAGAAVAVRVESDDYLYTIALPAFAVREMAIPELPRHLHFKTGASGVSELWGDQLCGFAHTELMGTVVVQDRGAFLSWCRGLASKNE